MVKGYRTPYRNPVTKGTCAVCGRKYRITILGTVRKHFTSKQPNGDIARSELCSGSRKPPARAGAA